NEPIETMRARLQWMSRKRGILETDLLLSTFANKHLKTMSHQALKEYDDLLEENDWDIYYWATGARKPPANVKAMLFWDDLFEHCKNSEKIVLRMPD
ncbi:Flavinator of succinate dehydrogenase-domain-containing protein, partial [Chytridium lagenaria]